MVISFRDVKRHDLTRLDAATMAGTVIAIVVIHVELSSALNVVGCRVVIWAPYHIRHCADTLFQELGVQPTSSLASILRRSHGVVDGWRRLRAVVAAWFCIAGGQRDGLVSIVRSWVGIVTLCHAEKSSILRALQAGTQ